METIADISGWPAHLCTTFNKLHEADACPTGYGKLANYIRDHFAVVPKDFGMDRPIPVALILRSNDFDDAWWTIRHAIAMARAFARGECTATELAEARRRAYAADAYAADAYAAAAAARRAERQWQSDRFLQALADEFAGCAATAVPAAQAASEEAVS